MFLMFQDGLLRRRKLQENEVLGSIEELGNLLKKSQP